MSVPCSPPEKVQLAFCHLDCFISSNPVSGRESDCWLDLNFPDFKSLKNCNYFGLSCPTDKSNSILYVH